MYTTMARDNPKGPENPINLRAKGPSSESRASKKHVVEKTEKPSYLQGLLFSTKKKAGIPAAPTVSKSGISSRIIDTQQQERLNKDPHLQQRFHRLQGEMRLRDPNNPRDTTINDSKWLFLEKRKEILQASGENAKRSVLTPPSVTTANHQKPLRSLLKTGSQTADWNAKAKVTLERPTQVRRVNGTPVVVPIPVGRTPVIKPPKDFSPVKRSTLPSTPRTPPVMLAAMKQAQERRVKKQPENQTKSPTRINPSKT